jgi:hypothetical protein
MKRLLGYLSSLLVIGSCPAHATTLKTVPNTLNAAKAYLLVEYKRVPNPFAGSPLAPKYVPQMAGLAFGRYDTASGDIRGLGKASDHPVSAKAGPTEFFQNRPLVKSETGLLYLLEVEPDTYVVQGWANTSFSLGSYQFEAKPGAIIDLGVVSVAADWPEGEGPKPLTAGRMMGIILSGPFQKAPPVAPSRVAFRPRGTGDIPLPSTLPVDHILPVSFEYGATFGNYLGGPVNRVDGVNVKREAAVQTVGASDTAPSPTVEAQLK